MPRFDKLLVLDLDETLVHASDTPLARPADLEIFDYHVYERPGLREFLCWSFDAFTVGVWTASSDDYASAVVQHVFVDAPYFVYSRDRCTWHMDLDTRDRVLLKPIQKLRKFGFPKERILFVDDTPSKLARSYGNYVRIHPFEGAEDDTELAALAEYLETLGSVPNVRAIEKRGWRKSSL
ncbi:MAG: HAD family hydrolase [Myxococcales bacterium]|nr:HAD family hydrolase [Myxococcales bacterium]